MQQNNGRALFKSLFAALKGKHIIVEAKKKLSYHHSYKHDIQMLFFTIKVHLTMMHLEGKSVPDFSVEMN